MTFPFFTRQTVYTGSPKERTLCVVGDVIGDGQPEIVIAGRKPVTELYWSGRGPDGRWARYIMDTDCGQLEAGGYLADINRNGCLDFVAEQDYSGNALFWWGNPADPTQPWPRHPICYMPENKSHDQLVADLDGDSHLELYFWNQPADTLFVAPVPDDSTISPWPDIWPVVTGASEEGLAVAGVDGDGRLELLAGQSWYKPLPDGSYASTRRRKYTCKLNKQKKKDKLLA